MLNYLDIKEKFEKISFENKIRIEIAMCVMSALQKTIKDEAFCEICSYVSALYYNGNCGYTQLIADVVVEKFESGELTVKAMEEDELELREIILNQIYERYYEML